MLNSIKLFSQSTLIKPEKFSEQKMMDTSVINDDFDDYNLVNTSSTSGSDASIEKIVPKESSLSLMNKLFAIASFWFGYNFVWTAISGTIMPGIIFFFF